MSHKSDSTTAESQLSSASFSISGFTPIELLMTITLLGILVAAFVPSMLSSEEESRRNALLKRLHFVRGLVDQYRQNHAGQLPAEGKNSAIGFMDELAIHPGAGTESENASTFAANAGIELPLLNPYTQRSEILVVPARLEERHFSGSGQHGWAYSSFTGEFRANIPPRITDRSGRLINQL